MNSFQKTTIDRLVEFMDFKNLNDNKITKLSGLSVGLIGRARRNKSGLHTDTIEKILTTFKDLNPTWLLTGNGEMILNVENIPDTKYSDKSEDTIIEEIFSTQRDIIALLKKQYFKSDI